MKKIAALLITVALLFTVSACKSNNETSSVPNTDSTISSVSQIQSDNSQNEKTSSKISQESSTLISSKEETSQTKSGTEASTEESSKTERTSSNTLTSSAKSEENAENVSSNNKPTNSSMESSSKICQHKYSAATCTAPKTCSICKTTEGNALGHKFSAATCSAPKTCSVCKATDGKALGHKLSLATCSAPKTCSVCKATVGDRAAHDFYAGSCKNCKAEDSNYTRFYSGEKTFSIAVNKTWKGNWGGSPETNGIRIVYGDVSYGYVVAFPIVITAVENQYADNYVSEGGATLNDTTINSEYGLIKITSNESYTVFCQYINQPKWLEGDTEDIENIKFILENKQEIIDSFRWE